MVRGRYGADESRRGECREIGSALMSSTAETRAWGAAGHVTSRLNACI